MAITHDILTTYEQRLRIIYITEYSDNYFLNLLMNRFVSTMETKLWHMSVRVCVTYNIKKNNQILNLPSRDKKKEKN